MCLAVLEKIVKKKTIFFGNMAVFVTIWGFKWGKKKKLCLNFETLTLMRIVFSAFVVFAFSMFLVWFCFFFIFPLFF